MKQITRNLSFLAVALIFGSLMLTACDSTAKTNTDDKNSQGANGQGNSAANEKANVENKTPENKAANQNSSPIQSDGLPELKKGEDYKTSVRAKMLKAGWKPARSKQADWCGSQETVCDEFEEYESQTGENAANSRANFRWQKESKFVEISTSKSKSYSFESYQFEKDSLTLAQHERWKEFWDDFKIAINKRDKEKLKIMMRDYIDGGGAFETREERLAAIEEGDMWEVMQKTVSEETKIEKCEKPCRITKDGYLIFEYNSNAWWRWTALGGEGQE